MELPKSIRFSSVISDPEAYIQEMFQLHPDAKHDQYSGAIEIKNPMIDSLFRYKLLEEGLFMFSFSSFSPVDAEFDFIPNPDAQYFTLVFYFTENRTKNPIYVKMDEKYYTSDQISIFFNGKMNAEFFVKAKQKAYGIRFDIHKKWFAENIEKLSEDSIVAKILNFSEKSFINTDCNAYHKTIENLLAVLEKEQYPLQKIDLKTISYSLINSYLDEMLQPRISDKKNEKVKFGELQAALNYMEKMMYDNFPRIDYLAELCGVSESTFEKKFKNSFHISPATHFKKIKMKEALRLLQLGHTVKEVSHKIGYKNTSSFGRSFKQFYGDSPASYVKQ